MLTRIDTPFKFSGKGLTLAEAVEFAKLIPKMLAMDPGATMFAKLAAFTRPPEDMVGKGNT